MPAADTILQARYRIVRQLGRGGMGAVYEAVDERLSRTIALKETLAESDDLKRAFEREARLLANLSHPVLPKVIDHFTEDAGQFVVMEYIPGNDLGELLERRSRPFSPKEVMRWADDLLDALEYLHTHEPPIVHRDIKPSNLKLTSKGKIVLLDFGLAKGGAGQMTRTTSGMSVIGYTLHYAALEQIQGERTGPRSDLYSLAATLYQLLTGQTPIDALKRGADLLNDERDPLVPIRTLNPEVPEHLASVLMQALSIKPSKRPASAAEMRATISQAPAVVVHGLAVDEDEITRVSVGAGRSGRLPAIAVGGDRTMVLSAGPGGIGPNGAGALENTADTKDISSNARKWWLIGGGASLALLVIVAIAFLLIRSGNQTVTPAVSPVDFESIPAPFRDTVPSIAALTLQDSEGRTLRQASGFFFKADELATSLSAIEGAAQGRVAVLGQSGALDITNVTGVDREHGVVTLRVARAKAPARGIGSKRQTTIGEQVAVLGSAGKAEPAFASGAIAGYRDNDLIEIGARAPDSILGGPILSADGEIIGIVTSSSGGGVVAVPISYLADLLRTKQQAMSLAVVGTTNVLYDWRKGETLPRPEIPKEVEQKIIDEVSRVHGEKAAQSAPPATPQAGAATEGAPPQGTNWWEDEMSKATVTGMAEGAFSAAGTKEVAYLIDTNLATEGGGPKYLAIFSGSTYVADFPVPNSSLILRTYDLNRDGVNELLLGYYQIRGGEIIQSAKIAHIAQSKLGVIKDFGPTYTSKCNLTPAPNPGVGAAAIFVAPAASGQTPELRVDYYKSPCAAEPGAEQWKYTSAAKLE